MLLKKHLKNKKKVGISVWNIDGTKTKEGTYSKTFTIYDTTADEVLEVIEKAIEQQNK